MTGTGTALASCAAGAGLFAAIYKAFVELEKDARPEAKKNTADFIQNIDKKPDFTLISRHILAFFESCFTRHHFSLECFKKSYFITANFVSIVLLFIVIKFHHAPSLFNSKLLPYFSDSEIIIPIINVINLSITLISFVAIVTSIAAIPDYLCFWKTRVMINVISRRQCTVFLTIFIILLDISISIIAMEASIFLYFMVTGSWSEIVMNNVLNLPTNLYQGYVDFYYAQDLTIYPVLLTSTVLTPLWVIGMFVSAIFTRMLMSLRYPVKMFTWLFSIEDHAIRIIGMMFGGLVWIAAVVYGIL